VLHLAVFTFVLTWQGWGYYEEMPVFVMWLETHKCMSSEAEN